MVSSLNSSHIKGAYHHEASFKPKEQEKTVQSITKQGDTSRIDELKTSIEKGEYRVDIEGLAKRIALELT